MDANTKNHTKNRDKTSLKNDTAINKICNNILKQIRPDNNVIVDADKIVKSINEVLQKQKLPAECVKGGSIAKDTFLKDDYDVDLFIRFNSTYKNKNISEITEKVLNILCDQLKVKLEKVHGSRDYYQFRLKKGKRIIIFEVIPVILIHAEDYKNAENITDLSPEHVNWVKKYTNKNSKLTDEIRLAKQFCKANKVYGAESYINGFSGHILDILIIHYGSFINLLNTFSKYTVDDLNKPIIVDTEKNLDNPLKQLNRNKITTLIVIDPIQKERNSAAALSKEKLLMFIEAARNFLKKPDKIFFEIKYFDIEKEIKIALKSLKSKEKDVNIVRIDFDTLEGSKDVVGTKILKAYESIIDHLKFNDFKVLQSDWNFIYDEKRAEAYLIIDKNISKELMQEGPPTKASEDYKKFVNKHVTLGHEILFKDNRVYAMVPRKFLDPKSFITDLSKKEFVGKRVRGLFVR